MGCPLEHVSLHKQPPKNKSRHGGHAPEHLEAPCPHMPTAHWTRKRLRLILEHLGFYPGVQARRVALGTVSAQEAPQP